MGMAQQVGGGAQVQYKTFLQWGNKGDQASRSQGVEADQMGEPTGLVVANK